MADDLATGDERTRLPCGCVLEAGKADRWCEAGWALWWRAVSDQTPPDRLAAAEAAWEAHLATGEVVP